MPFPGRSEGAGFAWGPPLAQPLPSHRAPRGERQVRGERGLSVRSSTRPLTRFPGFRWVSPCDALGPTASARPTRAGASRALFKAGDLPAGAQARDTINAHTRSTRVWGPAPPRTTRYGFMTMGARICAQGTSGLLWLGSASACKFSVCTNNKHERRVSSGSYGFSTFLAVLYRSPAPGVHYLYLTGPETTEPASCHLSAGL